MQQTRPLQDHPEFSVRRSPSHTEYRVENWRVARDGSGRVLRFYGWSWLDYVVPVLVAAFWQAITANRLKLTVTSALLALYVRAKCTQVLWESILVFPSLGLQLETHRGLPNIPLSVSRRFIPLEYLQDFVINEGLHGWNVRYYLVAIQKPRGKELSLQVAYENILPYFPVLQEIYRDIQQSVFNRDADFPAEGNDSSNNREKDRHGDHKNH